MSAGFVVRTADAAAWQRLLDASPYEVAKAFIQGAFDIDGDVLTAVRWWYQRRRPHAPSLIRRAAGLLNVEAWFQTRGRARRNIAFHYDRSNEFYQQFLDRRLVYSSAYFNSPSMSLDEAQLAKLDYTLRKLDLHAGERFLDVGCGWGALILRAAQHFKASATGCTLSGRQFEYAQHEIGESDAACRARVELRDYRQLTGPFDKIASVGMYEHVGRHRIAEYFVALGKLLTPDGLVLNSGIARSEAVRDDDQTAFLRRFVFPGGELPYLSDVIRAAENAGLEVLDIENLRQHYALTCVRWVKRLQEHRGACLSLVDRATYRTWLLYLAGSVVSFERGASELYQILLAKRRGPVRRRLTRRYMYA